MTKTRTEKIYIILIAVVVLIIGLVLFFGLRNRNSSAAPAEPAAEPEETQKIVEVEKIIRVDKEITAETIEDGLREMGSLITQQYYFTEVVSFSKVKKLFNTDIALKFTESGYLASYDGTVDAGLDFAAVRASKDEAGKTVTVHIPHSEILNVHIDPNSFVLYSEKTGISNPLSAADFNQSLIELEETAISKALERGLLEKADQNAESIISNFIGSLLDREQYSVQVVFEETEAG